MSFISVSAKKIRVHLSPEHLSVTSENSHSSEDDVVTDVSILPVNHGFIQFFKSSKDSWLNIYKIKKEGDKEIIQSCLKSKSNNLSYVAASKLKGGGMCYATGYSNGQIKIRSIQTSNIVKEFSAPPNASSVFFLDFNSCDEHLASVHEDGLINVYGLQTSVKLHSFTLDNQSTLARFHPQKRSHLAVASYSGKVSLLDIFAKKTIFKADGHAAPCTDVAMFEDFLLTSGYDSVIKIYDLRKKTPGIQIQSCYGWTSLALSKCGVYFVGGNMKGELISYDMRYIKKPLASSRVENSNIKISRVAFLTNEDANDTCAVDLSKAVRQSLCKIEEEVDGPPAYFESNDNFIEDILGFQRGRISDFSSSVINHGTRVSTASRRSSTDSLFADYYGKNMQAVLKELSSPVQSPASTSMDDSKVNKSRRRISGKDGKSRSSIGTTLHEINEELNDKENIVDTPNTPISLNNPPRYSSTPAIVVSEAKGTPSNAEKEVEVIEIEGDDSFKSVQNIDIPKHETIPAEIKFNIDFRKEFDALAEKVHIEVGCLAFDQNMRHLQMMTHVSEQNRQLQSRVQMIEDCITALMNDDFKINLINDLTSENQQLRQQVQDLTRRLSH